MGFLLVVSTASVDPPQLPEMLSPVLHCGMSAARQFPLVFAAVPWRKIGPHAATCQLANLPRDSPWYHSSLKSASVEIRSFWIRSCQKLMTFCVSLESRLIVTSFLPS